MDQHGLRPISLASETSTETLIQDGFDTIKYYPANTMPQGRKLLTHSLSYGYSGDNMARPSEEDMLISSRKYKAQSWQPTGYRRNHFSSSQFCVYDNHSDVPVPANLRDIPEFHAEKSSPSSDENEKVFTKKFLIVPRRSSGEETTDGKVKARVRLVSPAIEWEERQKEKRKHIFTNNISNIIKSGWRVRNKLAAMQRSDPTLVNDFYLQTVASGHVADVKAIFSCCKTDPSLPLDRDCVDQRKKGAFRLAIENCDAAMCEVLLKNKVSLGYDLFHAIERNFVEGVETILKHDSCIDSRITKHNYYFNIGMTPIILAACNNNYDILKLLRQHSHQITESKDWWEGIHLAWESALDRMMRMKAKASPAYITLMCEEDALNPLEYCIDVIKDIREIGNLEPELYDFYVDLEKQVENYMCHVLDQVQSSEELAHLFQYDFDAYWNTKKYSHVFGNGATSRRRACVSMTLLETACKFKLVKFVTHRNSQLALSYVRFRYTSFLRGSNMVKNMLIDLVFGALFPIWSIFYLVAPGSKLGGVITLPNVAFSCHLMSDVAFIAILIANVLMKSARSEYIGAPPTALEWLIFSWILGQMKREFRECANRGMKDYFGDWWNYADLTQLLLFSTAIILRILDYANHHDDPVRLFREKWAAYEPRILASGFFAWGYVFVFLRLLGQARTNRVLGPLQVSLAKMMLDIIQFLCIFSLVLFAFALALSELYWYYGTPQGSALLCNRAENDSSAGDCPSPVFAGLGPSIGDLFWAIFNYFDPTAISLHGKHEFNGWISMSLVGAYHIVAVIILINMLIAMMAKSFEVTSENKENEWKFHRTALWLRFIRREFTRPPPMNLIPNPSALYRRTNALFTFLCCSLRKEKRPVQGRYRQKQLRHREEHEIRLQLKDLKHDQHKIVRDLKRQLSINVMYELVQRYKYSNLLNDEDNRQDMYSKL